jgi:hypothetical protein
LADFYVNGDTGYDTTLDGTSPTVDGGGVGPWATINKAHDTMSDGDTANIAAGNYPEILAFISTQSGKTLTYKRYGAGTLIMNPSLSSQRVLDFTACVDGSDFTFEDIEFRPTGTHSFAFMRITDTADIHLTLTRCHIEGLDNNNSNGIFNTSAMSSSTREVTFDSCTINNNRVAGNYGFARIVDLYKFSIIDCTMISDAPASTMIDITQSNVSPDEFLIKGNSFTGADTFLLIKGVSSSFVPTLTASKITIVNNTFVSAGTFANILNMSWSATLVLGVGELLFSGNKCDALTGRAITLRGAAGSACVCDNDITKSNAVVGADVMFLFGIDPIEPPTGPGFSGDVNFSYNKISYDGIHANNHGCLIAQGVESGIVRGNRMDLNSVLGLVIKGANNLLIESNFIKAPVAMYLKSDSTSNKVINNHCIGTARTSGVADPAALLWQKEDATGLPNIYPHFNDIYNNIFEADDAIGLCFRDSTDDEDPGVYGHGGNALNNNVYNPTGGATLAEFQGVEYSTMATLQAAWGSVGNDPDSTPPAVGNELESVMEAPEVGFSDIPLSGGNCDVGKGSSVQRQSGFDVYKRPKLDYYRDCIGCVYPQRDLTENNLERITWWANE